MSVYHVCLYKMTFHGNGPVNIKPINLNYTVHCTTKNTWKVKLTQTLRMLIPLLG